MERMQQLAASACGASLSAPSQRLLDRLALDPGVPIRCWSMAELARHLGQGPPAREALLQRLRGEGFQALASGVMPAQFRSDAPWPRLLELARDLVSGQAAKPRPPDGDPGDAVTTSEGAHFPVPTTGALPPRKQPQGGLLGDDRA